MDTPSIKYSVNEHCANKHSAALLTVGITPLVGGSSILYAFRACRLLAGYVFGQRIMTMSQGV